MQVIVCVYPPVKLLTPDAERSVSIVACPLFTTRDDPEAQALPSSVQLGVPEVVIFGDM